MLLHIRPRFFSSYRYVELIDLDIKPFGLHLEGGKDLATRRPYPNKRYAVACRKRGKKAIDGILLETGWPVNQFTYEARWAVEDTLPVSHRVEYKILDREFDAASDDMTLWYACSRELGGWSNRFPPASRRFPPLVLEPLMELIAEDVDARRNVTDSVECGMILARREVFAMPTIERDRLLQTKLNERIPTIEMAFPVG